MAAALITLAAAKARVRVTATHEDATITTMAEQATSIVIDYLKRSNHGWTSDNVPSVVQCAILDQLEWMFSRDPGDAAAFGLAPGIDQLLKRQRDPALA